MWNTDQYTLWLSTQSAWLERTDAAQALGVPEENIRSYHPHRRRLLRAARRPPLPRDHPPSCGWLASSADRSATSRLCTEQILPSSSMHGREAYTDGEVAFDHDGRVRALRLRIVANFGVDLMKYSGGPPIALYFPTGAYDIFVDVQSGSGRCLHPHRPMGPYRGAGRPEAAYFIERVMSDVAHALGMDQAENPASQFRPARGVPLHQRWQHHV